MCVCPRAPVGHTCTEARGEQQRVMDPLGLVVINYHVQVLGTECRSSGGAPGTPQC